MQSSKCRLVIRVLKELNEDLNTIKKVQSEMRDTLIEIKNNLQVPWLVWLSRLSASQPVNQRVVS